MPKFAGTTPESPSNGDEDKLKCTNSYCYRDGISVITMGITLTLEQIRKGGGVWGVGNGEVVYLFYSMMERPPTSITIEDNSGSYEGKGRSFKGKARKTFKEDKGAVDAAGGAPPRSKRLHQR